MPETRTAVLQLFPFAHPEDLLPHTDGPLKLNVDELGELIPDGRNVLFGMRDGGWQLDYAAIENGLGVDDDGRPLRDICINFIKDFSPADAHAVIADAKSCGASEDWGNPNVFWSDERETDEEDSDENGRWDMTGARIG